MSFYERMAMLERLLSVVSAACSDPGFHWELRHDPRHALATYGLSASQFPASLSIYHAPISVLIEPTMLFGIVDPSLYEQVSETLRSHPAAILMQAGAKPMLLLYGPESFASTVCDWAYKRCFTALLSPGEFVPEVDTIKGCYSNRHVSYRPAHTGSGAWRGVLVAREPERVMLGWLSLLFGWDVFLGMLLGYPQCCIAAFAERWPQAHEHFQGDVAALLVAASGHDAFVGDYGWETNVYVRYQDIEIIQHFPCRLDCELTAILAHRHYDALQMIDPNLAERLVLTLAAPVLITDGDGVFSFTGAKVTCTGEDVTLHYNSEDVLATYAAGELYQTLAAHHELTLQRQSRTVIIGSHRTAGRLINFRSYRAKPSRLEAGAYCKGASDEIHLPTTH